MKITGNKARMESQAARLRGEHLLEADGNTDYGARSMRLSPALVDPLKDYMAAAVAGKPLPVGPVRTALAGIPDEAIRMKAIAQFHLVHLLAAVMKHDRSRYAQSVHRGCMELLKFLRESCPPEAAA